MRQKRQRSGHLPKRDEGKFNASRAIDHNDERRARQLRRLVADRVHRKGPVGSVLCEEGADDRKV